VVEYVLDMQQAPQDTPLAQRKECESVRPHLLRERPMSIQRIHQRPSKTSDRYLVDVCEGLEPRERGAETTYRPVGLTSDLFHRGALVVCVSKNDIHKTKQGGFLVLKGI